MVAQTKSLRKTTLTMTDDITPSAHNTENPFPTADEIYAYSIEYTGNLILTSHQRTQRQWGFTEGSDYIINLIQHSYSQLKEENEKMKKRVEELQEQRNSFKSWLEKQENYSTVEEMSLAVAIEIKFDEIFQINEAYTPKQ